MVAAVAVGGAIGAQGRYGVELLVPRVEGFPWATLAVNVLGCLLVGALMAVLAGLDSPHRLAQPLLGPGVLGGFTTFSAFAVDVHGLLIGGRPVVAIAYLVGTPGLALISVWVGAAAARTVVSRPGPEGAT